MDILPRVALPEDLAEYPARPDPWISDHYLVAFARQMAASIADRLGGPSSTARDLYARTSFFPVYGNGRPSLVGKPREHGLANARRIAAIQAYRQGVQLTQDLINKVRVTLSSGPTQRRDPANRDHEISRLPRPS